jgi:hypothetical protein
MSTISVPSLASLGQWEVLKRSGMSAQKPEILKCLKTWKINVAIDFNLGHFLLTNLDFSIYIIELETQPLHHFVGFLMSLPISIALNKSYKRPQ